MGVARRGRGAAHRMSPSSCSGVWNLTPLTSKLVLKNGFTSTPILITSGAPQGSNRGLLLFNCLSASFLKKYFKKIKILDMAIASKTCFNFTRPRLIFSHFLVVFVLHIFVHRYWTFGIYIRL